MKLKLIISLICLIGIVFIGNKYLFNSPNSNLTIESEHASPTLSTVKQESYSQTKPENTEEKTETLVRPNLVSVAENQLEQQNEHSEFVTDPTLFSETFVFTDNDQEFVSKSAIDNIFKMNTEQLFNTISKVEYSEEAQIRENTLSRFIIDELNDVNVVDQQIECAGKVCAVEMIYTESNLNSINKLSTFTTNYAFEQFIDLENGDKKLKALYIATEDP